MVKSVVQFAAEAVALFTHEARTSAMWLIFRVSGVTVIATPDTVAAEPVSATVVFAKPVLSVSRFATVAKALISPVPAWGGVVRV